MDTTSQTVLSHFPAPYNQSVELLRESSETPRVCALDPIRAVKPNPGRWLGWWHLTSLDAPTVAVVWCEALARIVHVVLPLWVPLALGLGTWAIYLSDRLMDAKRALAPLRERHWFHWRHRAVLVPLAAISLIAAVALVLREMPPAIRQRNSVLALAALVYFTAIHTRRSTAKTASVGWRRLFTKETFVGLIFALVCAAPAATRSGHGWAMLIAPVSSCFLLAWLNCWLIEHWDSGVSIGICLPLALATFTLCAALLAFTLNAVVAAFFLASTSLSAVLLAGLGRYRCHFNALLLRAAADLVLLTPLLIFLLRVP